MGYDDSLRGAPIKFPKAAKPSREAVLMFKAPKAPTAKKPRAAKKRRALKVPKTISYATITAKNPLRAPTAVEAVLGAGGAQRIGRSVAAQVARTGGVAITGAGAAAALAAGAIAYALTSHGLTAFAMKKATRRENAARLADAYRFARQKMADDQGYPLNKTQLKQFANAFKTALLKLGLSSSDLSQLGGRSAYER